MIDVQELVPCLYCGNDAQLYEKNAHHPYASEHGPFQIYVCRSCSSLLTYPVPSGSVLNALYRSFDKGMHSKVRELRTKYPLHAWFRQCIRHMMKGAGFARKEFSWIDVGAGEGEMCKRMVETFPVSKGMGVDFHGRPGALDKTNGLGWMAADLNEDLPVELGTVDLIFAITVFEHMANPVHFIRSSLDLLKPGGVLYFNCPRADANAFRIMRKKWPYYLPGEHITIPSITGLEQLMRRECDQKFGNGYTLKIAPVIMPYPLGYYLGYYLPFTKNLFSLTTSVYIPTGLLECHLLLPH